MRPFKALLLVAAMLGMGGCSGSHDAPRDRVVSSAAAPGRPAAGLNVPSLLSLSIDDLSQRIGPRKPLPPGFSDPTLIPLLQRHERLDSTAYFQTPGLALVASFDYRTRRVSDIMLLGSNENELMHRAQLQLGADHYLVLPVFQENHPTRLLGLRVLGIALNQ
ncbi:hypothetical protein Q3A66_03780 [Hymenobacter sp. BT770]|uniref:hypothetical protein n=1 Tax=Hymenobacter sp. BT770 TaxID=2886942 RepID=UPI001D128130|nr:hypothetical protein [Hymenobacter sp. BT770]MCC3152363.1 hypothetical protein [Hymenobacter sp. BT770]MDO3414176.1 hypothetical protein [Hymenobacter sp. BT770]